MADPVAAQEVDQAPPMAVEAGAPFGQEDEEMAGAQEAGKTPPTAVEDGVPPG
jgi:hypothetical protein